MDTYDAQCIISTNFGILDVFDECGLVIEEIFHLNATMGRCAEDEYIFYFGLVVDGFELEKRLKTKDHGKRKNSQALHHVRHSGYRARERWFHIAARQSHLGEDVN